MKTFAFTIMLRNDPDIIEKYKQYHRKVWPEVLKSGTNMGIKWQKIFLLGHRLFMVFQADDSYDPENMINYASTPRIKEWDDLMRSFQVPVEEAKKGEWWAQMELVFDLEWYCV